LKPEKICRSRLENEKPENEKQNSRFTLIGPLLQGVAYCIGITKPHEIIVNIFFCLFVHAVKGIQLEPT